MKHLIILLLLLPSLAMAQPANFGPKRGVSLGPNTQGYYEYLPANYNINQKYPLLLTLHGIGERGNGNAELAKLLGTGTGLPWQISQTGFPKPWLVISPQFVNWPTGAQIQTIITNIMARYPVDQYRIYVTGLSMGGGALWDVASLDNRLAAIIPICGAQDWNQAGVNFMTASSTPVWAFHDQYDPTVAVSNTTNWITKLNAAGINPVAIKTITYEGTHGTWNMVYSPGYVGSNGLTPWDWMYQYTKGSTQPPIPGPGKDTLFIPAEDTRFVNMTSGWVHTATDIYGYPVHINGTDNQAMYNVERFGVFNYKIPVPNGQYTVRLHFTELFHNSVGKRVFNVDIEGARVLNNFDILTQVAKFTALQKAYIANVNDGELNINLTKTVDNAQLVAIEVVKGAVGTIRVITQYQDSATNKVLATDTTYNRSKR